MNISEEEAKELAEKFASVVLNRTVLRKNITVTKSGDEWNVEIITTPMRIGEPKERIKFTLKKDAKVSAWGTSTV